MLTVVYSPRSAPSWSDSGIRDMAEYLLNTLNNMLEDPYNDTIIVPHFLLISIFIDLVQNRQDLLSSITFKYCPMGQRISERNFIAMENGAVIGNRNELLRAAFLTVKPPTPQTQADIVWSSPNPIQSEWARLSNQYRVQSIDFGVENGETSPSTSD